MDLRYLGFEQRLNSRLYRFDAKEKGQPARSFTVTAELALFLRYGVGIQDGPSLCATKLAADLGRDFDGAHELTEEDLRLYSDARNEASAQRAARRAPRRRVAAAGAQEESRSTWRNFGL